MKDLYNIFEEFKVDSFSLIGKKLKRRLIGLVSSTVIKCLTHAFVGSQVQKYSDNILTGKTSLPGKTPASVF